jgi:hypothetical protein
MQKQCSCKVTGVSWKKVTADLPGPSAGDRGIAAHIAVKIKTE